MFLYNAEIWFNLTRFQHACIWKPVLALAGMILGVRVGTVFWVGQKPLAQRSHASSVPTMLGAEGSVPGKGSFLAYSAN